MQFLAFLKDSYREARSGWMLQVMLVLAFIMIVLVASIGYRPLSIQEEISDKLHLITGAMSFNRQAYDELGNPKFSIQNVIATNAEEPWKSDYQFDFVVTCGTHQGLDKLRESDLPARTETVQSFLRQMLHDQYRHVDVEEPGAATMAVGGGLTIASSLIKDTDERFSVRVSGSMIEDALAWTHRLSVFFVWDMSLFDMSLRKAVYYIEKYIVVTAGIWVLLFIGVVVTAGFIPNMLAKGSMDLFISKPIGRSRLFVYKYIGGLLFVLLLTSISIFGFWLVIGLRAGFWTPNFLYAIPVVTFYFAILYAVSATTAMFTRNSLVAILITILAWGLLWGIGQINDGIEDRREAEIAAKEGKINPLQMQKGGRAPKMDNPRALIDSDAPLWGVIPHWTFPFFTMLQTISPRNYQIDDRLSCVIAEGVLTPNELKAQGYDKPPRHSWVEMIGVSLVFIAVCLGISCWRFETRDL